MIIFCSVLEIFTIPWVLNHWLLKVASLMEISHVHRHVWCQSITSAGKSVLMYYTLTIFFVNTFGHSFPIWVTSMQWNNILYFISRYYLLVQLTQKVINRALRMAESIITNSSGVSLRAAFYLTILNKLNAIPEKGHIQRNRPIGLVSWWSTWSPSISKYRAIVNMHILLVIDG